MRRKLRRRNPRMRTVRISGSPQQTKRCRVCGVVTQERKDYCTEHVERHPYVASLIHKIKMSDKEVERVRMYGYQAISDDSIILNDIIVILQTRGKRTVERLAREVIQDIDIVERYVEYLYQRDLVDIYESGRGKIVVVLREPSNRRYRRYFR